jgi:hypothetical protein
MSGISGSSNSAGMVQQLQQIQQQAEQATQGAGNAQGSQFADMVNKAGQPQQAGQVDNVQGMDIVAQVQKTEAARINKVSAMMKSQGVSNLNVPKAEAKDGISKLLGGVMSGQNKLDGIIKMATSGRQFNPTELLAIQAGVYKFSQELELTSKVVEKATSGVKQTLQTQV